MPKVDVETRSKSAREVQLKAADRLSTTDTSDQQTTARAMASEKRVSQTTETSDAQVKQQEPRQAKLSAELSYELVRPEADKLSPDKPEF